MKQYQIETCSECLHFAKLDIIGECRVGPPQMLTQYVSGYPPVRADNAACAMCEPKPKPKAKRKPAVRKDTK